MATSDILWFNQISMQDLAKVGGKNASLGEMITQLTQLGIRVPMGFATTASAFWRFLEKANLINFISQQLSVLNVDDVAQLSRIGQEIRERIINTSFDKEFIEAVAQSYEKLSEESKEVAVRSSATAEDLPTASFAGQQETYLNICGIDQVLLAIKKVFASLYTDRAIAYRVHHGFSHDHIALSVGIQSMVRSDMAASGVMFTMDTESGFDQVIFITSSYGLGELVVQGAVNPDEFYVYKPNLVAKRPAILRRFLGSKAEQMVYSKTLNDKKVEANYLQTTVERKAVDPALSAKFSLTDQEIEELAHYGLIIEQHYGRPMDIEWAKDGITNKLYILQARPETVNSQVRNDAQMVERYQLKTSGKVLTTGRSIGHKIGQGQAKVLRSLSELDKVQPGDVLVTDMTDPDWEPIMKKASGIVTNRGGRTCHAAIIARELGIPAVVGCGNATETVSNGTLVTVNCAEGESGYVYEGKLTYEVFKTSVATMPTIATKIMLNVGNPERAFTFQAIPNHGVGLARLEFLISNTIGIHPKALLEFENLSTELKSEIEKKTAAYASPVEYYISKLQEGISTIAAAFYPKPVIVRLSDFKSNEYANLLGGHIYEPHEENPMLGFRGASRYFSPVFKECFALECEAVKRVRQQMGLTNVEVMIPFVRTVKEAEAVVATLQEQGLRRGQEGLRLIMMCEIPSNALLAEKFLEYFDGFSIGSNDLTQLTLGLDRDSALVAAQFDERDEAVKYLLAKAIRTCKAQNKYVGICGQGPSDHADFAEWLVKEKIDSISLNPDTAVETWVYLAKSERE